MGIFSRIMDKLRGHSKTGAPQSGGLTGSTQAQASPQGPASTPAAAMPMQDVDVDAVLSQLASAKGGGGNYKTSIVDLLKLLDLDSSLDARKELAAELNVNAGAHGSAEQNIALHKAVVQKLEENGGKVPASMKS
jgi:hypothetical protein